MTFHIQIFLRILKIQFKISVCTIIEHFMKRACKLVCNFLCGFTHCIVHALTYFVVVKFCCDIVNIGDGTPV